MLETRRTFSSFLSLFVMLLSRTSVGAFNLDTQFPIIFSGPARSYFGYTVAMFKKADQSVVLVGAPTANSTIQTASFQPGVLFSCDINSTVCEDVFSKNTYFMRYNMAPKVSFRMWLGATLDVTPDFDRTMNGYGVVVCGHRGIRGHASVNGLCCIFGKSLMPTDGGFLKPLENADKQYIYDDKDNVYRSYFNNGQAGMSATFSQDGSHLIVGAPGIYEGTGSVFYYNGSYSTYQIQSRSFGVKKTSTGEKHAYFGYAITSGNFFNLTKDQFAVGAPRGESHGKVFIISTSDTEEVSILQVEKGSELGEYFGATLLGVDLNADSFTDLIVGSPLYASETGCDEGKVTVYVSDRYTLKFHSHLHGDGKSDARFGTSLAAIEDLDHDGFKDFAVGAPYEDGKGAVYIYRGSETGVIAEYSQKIEASQVHSNLAGFGIHISRGVDIDDNGYPDIVVGSYISSNAVLLRSRPALTIFARMISIPDEINMANAECDYSGKKLPCVHLHYCFLYSRKHGSASHDFQCALFEEDEDPRGFFPPYRPKNSIAHFNLTVKRDLVMCLSKQFYLLADIKDTVTPIRMNLSCELAPSTTPNDTFDSKYPVVSPYSTKSWLIEIPFHNGCANDETCHADLIVEAELLGEAKFGAITLGNVSSVSMDIAVRNEGEPAYSSELLVYLPPEISIINKDFCVTRSNPGKEIVACELGNPLVKNKQVNIRIKLDVTKIASHTKFVEIFLEASTNSSETNPNDNILTISLEVKRISDIGIRGKPSHHLILYQKDHEMSSEISHKFLVRNYGPSPIQKINVLLQVPHVVLDSKERRPFLHFTGLQTDGTSENILSASCETSSEYVEISLKPASELDYASWENDTFFHHESYSTTTSASLTRKRSITEDITKRNLYTSHTEMRSEEVDSRQGSNLQISCSDEKFGCVTIQCSASTFSDVNKFAEISVSFKMDYTVLDYYFDKWHQIELLTKGSISTSDSDVLLSSDHSDITLVKTVLYCDVKSEEEIPHWLFSVGAFLGSMVLFLIIIFFLKVGFFRRKEREILQRLERSLAASNTDEDLLIDPSDDSSTENE